MADQDNYVEVRMLVTPSGKGDDSQWFDYRPSFFGDIVRVEWELGTNDVSLTADVAEYLIKHGYAQRLGQGQIIIEHTPLVEEPLVVETIDQPLSAPSADTTASAIPAEPPADPSSPTPSQSPPAAETAVNASSGGKQRKKEKAR